MFISVNLCPKKEERDTDTHRLTRIKKKNCVHLCQSVSLKKEGGCKNMEAKHKDITEQILTLRGAGRGAHYVLRSRSV